jgi:uncharacterized membrane protein YkoI
VSDKRPRYFQKMTAAAVAIGLGVGAYGIASAASGSGSTAAQSSGTTTVQQPAQGAPPQGMPPQGGPHRGPGGVETALTGDALAKVTAIANAKVPGATIERVETDADGHAKYEAHVRRSDGTEATVYVDAQFQFVSVQNGR